MSRGKEKALEIALSRIEKGSIVRLRRVRLGGNVDVIPAGALPLDVALGVGGILRGRGAAEAEHGEMEEWSTGVMGPQYSNTPPLQYSTILLMLLCVIPGETGTSRKDRSNVV